MNTKSQVSPAVRELFASNPGLCEALSALGHFRRRHVWKENRKVKLVKRRIKDRSASGERRWNARRLIRVARAKGFRGSIAAFIREWPAA